MSRFAEAVIMELAPHLRRFIVSGKLCLSLFPAVAITYPSNGFRRNRNSQ